MEQQPLVLGLPWLSRQVVEVMELVQVVKEQLELTLPSFIDFWLPFPLIYLKLMQTSLVIQRFLEPLEYRQLMD